MTVENRSQSCLNGYVQTPSITLSAQLPGLIYHPKPASRVSLDLSQGEVKRYTHQGKAGSVEYYGKCFFVAIIRADNTWLVIEVDGSIKAQNRLSIDRDELGIPFVAAANPPEFEQRILDRTELMRVMRSDRTPEILDEAKRPEGTPQESYP